MNIFLDSCVAVAASLSTTGASREVFNHAARQGWRLFVSPWVLREVRENLANKPPEAAHAWVSLRAKATVEDDELTFGRRKLFSVKAAEVRRKARWMDSC